MKQLTEALAAWMPTRRWFTAKGASPRITHAQALGAGFAPGTTGGGAPAQTVCFLVEAGGLTFQVPLTFRRGPAAGAGASMDATEGTVAGAPNAPAGAPIAKWSDENGPVAVWDATSDPAGQRAIFEALFAGGLAGPTASAGTPLPSAGAPTPASTPAPAPIELAAHALTRPSGLVVRARQLSSEQSNTSIIYELEGAAPIILKVFRVLSDGQNPDVVVQEALDQAGGPVPTQHGHISGRWDGKQTEFVVAQEFLTGATDAWQVVTAELRRLNEAGELANANHDRIRQLGVMTREIHEILGRTFPVVDAGQRRAQIVASWRERANQALAQVPELEEYRERILALYERAGSSAWPQLQRVHGDYHLGQVLDVPGRGWVALDFEGEPLRPLAERVLPDLALRDVAGMLRSLDYAAGTIHLEQSAASSTYGGELENWLANARAAFLAGYGEIAPEHTALLDALVLDKALYEVSYEVVSRPDWVGIPLGGIRRLFINRKL